MGIGYTLWDFKEPIHHELLKRKEMANFKMFCRQMNNLNKALIEKRSTLVNRKQMTLHHRKLHSIWLLNYFSKIVELDWESLLNLTYFQDLTPSDYYILLSMQKFLNGKNSKLKQISLGQVKSCKKKQKSCIYYW